MEPLIKHYRYKNPSTNPRGGITIAIEGVEGDPTSVCFAFALCHPNDNFIKITGRNKAIGRLKSSKYADMRDLGKPVDLTTASGRKFIFTEIEDLLISEGYLSFDGDGKVYVLNSTLPF